MAIWIEVSPPFVWKPKIERAGDFVGVLWAWFRVGRVPYDLNEFVEGIANAGVTLHKKGDDRLTGGHG